MQEPLKLCNPFTSRNIVNIVIRIPDMSDMNVRNMMKLGFAKSVLKIWV